MGHRFKLSLYAGTTKLDSICPSALAKLVSMKITHMFSGRLDEGEVIAYFGQARLVRRLDCKFEVRGGSMEDHSAAQEWISLFMHEAVLITSPERGCLSRNCLNKA